MSRPPIPFDSCPGIRGYHASMLELHSMIRFLPTTRATAPGIAALLLFLGLTAAPARGQSLGDYREFYRLMRVNAGERLTFCYPTTTQGSDPLAFGVEHDSLGRVARVT